MTPRFQDLVVSSYLVRPQDRTQRTQTSSSRILCDVLFLWVAVDSSNQFVEFLGCKWLQQKIKKSTNQQEHLNIKHSSESSRDLAESRYSVCKISGICQFIHFLSAHASPKSPKSSTNTPPLAATSNILRYPSAGYNPKNLRVRQIPNVSLYSG